jgi:hypothetical protein
MRRHRECAGTGNAQAQGIRRHREWHSKCADTGKCTGNAQAQGIRRHREYAGTGNGTVNAQTLGKAQGMRVLWLLHD